MITVKVIRESTGSPIKGARVALGFSSLGRGVTSNEYTDDEGEAHFDADNGDGKVFVNGSTEYEGYLQGRLVIYR